MELPISKVIAAEPEQVYRLGKETIVLNAGKHLKVATSPRGDELLDAVVPDGKVWTVNVQITVKEVDA